MLERWIEWVEPYGPNDEPVYMRVTAETAIAKQKVQAAKWEYVYQNDEQALEDFLTINYGWLINV